MKINEIIGKAVAEKTGKCWHESYFEARNCQCGVPEIDLVTFSQELYDYSDNLDDITEAVRVLCDTPLKEGQFVASLEFVLPKSDYSTLPGARRIFAITTASAKQKSEALIKVLEQR